MIRKPRIEMFELEETDVAPGRVESAAPIIRAAELLAGGGVAGLRIHPAGASKQVAITRAETALAAVTRVLVERYGLPPEAYVEVDEESYGTPVAPFRDRRFLLPHQDGGHCSFLTPSRLDYPDLHPDERVYSETVYWKRPSHKLYQGFLITNTGTQPGVTYYYNTLTLLRDAFLHRHGRAPEDISELARFNVENLRHSKKNQAIHGSRYVTLGALLGSPELAHHVMPSGPRAESELWPVQYISLPVLSEMADRCPCGACRGTGEKLFCHACVGTLGRTWPEFRRDYESAVIGERHDLLIGNNLTQLHAADSHASRTIRPMCIVSDRAEGEAYERWLAAQWRAWDAPVGSVQQGVMQAA
ncbi:MAG TPA: hypothetical protein VF527_17900 [Pyrinomonadaceae bacterium]|jgi:hypothetical protein